MIQSHMAMISSKKPVFQGAALDTETPLPDIATFTRAHSSRLKWYFQHSMRGGAAALPDNIDLDLSVANLISRIISPYGSTVHYAITPRGEAMVAALRDHSRSQRAPHHALGKHLAQWLAAQGRMTWEDCCFDVTVSSGVVRTTRPDVFSTAITMNMDKWDPQVHEIKVSRADFLSDIKNPEKREAYFLVGQRVSYATPFGLISKEEVPKECGWIEQSQDGAQWIVRKVAPKKKGWKMWEPRMWMTLVVRSHPALKELN